MAKGNHPGRISDEKIEQIYLAWMDGISLKKLEKRFGVSCTTISKYKQRDKWDERKAKIQSVVAKRLDKSATARKTRRAKLGAKLQAEGLKKVKGGIKNEQVALNAIKLGAELEDQAYGDSVDESTVITIKLPKGTQIGYRPIQPASDN
jgi:transposase